MKIGYLKRIIKAIQDGYTSGVDFYPDDDKAGDVYRFPGTKSPGENDSGLAMVWVRNPKDEDPSEGREVNLVLGVDIDGTNAGQSKVFIGWISLNPDGTPYRQERSKGEWFGRTEPIKIYTSKKRAETYGPKGGMAVRVYV